MLRGAGTQPARPGLDPPSRGSRVTWETLENSGRPRTCASEPVLRRPCLDSLEVGDVAGVGTSSWFGPLQVSQADLQLGAGQPGRGPGVPGGPYLAHTTAASSADCLRFGFTLQPSSVGWQGGRGEGGQTLLIPARSSPPTLDRSHDLEEPRFPPL